jgi:hypothetical protein
MSAGDTIAFGASCTSDRTIGMATPRSRRAPAVGERFATNALTRRGLARRVLPPGATPESGARRKEGPWMRIRQTTVAYASPVLGSVHKH